MKDIIKILFTGVGRRVELVQAFRSAALSLDVDLLIYGADMDETAPALYYCDYTRKVPPMREASYVESLLQICETDQINAVIPTIDTDLLVLAKNKCRFEEIGVQVLISEPEKIAICRDKNITSKFFIECGLKAPMPVNDWKKYEGGFPAFIKPKDGSSSINAYKVNTLNELETYAKSIDDYVVQPFIEGREYTIDIFCDWEGEPISIVPRERLQIRAGEVLKTRIAMDEKMINEAKALCSAFKPCGPITVQLIRDKTTQQDYFIEINPRFGGGAPLSMKAGARSAEYILKLLKGEAAEICTDIDDGAVYSRFDQSVSINSGTQSNTIRGFIFDLDDTLYPEFGYVASGFSSVARYLGDDSLKESLLGYFERGQAAIDSLLEDLGKGEIKQEVLEVYRSHKPNVELYEGVETLLKELKKRGYKLGIITDGRAEGQRNKVKALGIEDIIDDLIITDELGGPQFRKPCDIAFRIMQMKWKLPTNQIAYIGDNLRKDFQAPAQLGMKCFYVSNPEGLYYDENTGKSLTAGNCKKAFTVINHTIVVSEEFSKSLV